MSWRFMILLLVFDIIKGQQLRPNIVFILADDLGFNDVSWHNDRMYTPTLASLAKRGLVFENAYAQPNCSPSRAALLTGYYPVHTGRQNGIIKPREPTGLFTNFTLLPQHLKRLGYKTHLVGKWHLGFCHRDYLPTRRGFDTFYGMYLGSQDYFDHTRRKGFDFRDQDRSAFEARGNHSTDLHSMRAASIIDMHAKSQAPFFLLLSLQSPHSPIQPPKRYNGMFPGVKNTDRREYMQVVAHMDDAVQTIVASLLSGGLYNNTIIVFSSDNGGNFRNGGSNAPLRGNKANVFEGGTRVPAFIHAPEKLKRTGTYHGLFHISDWLPTLYSAAGGRNARRRLGNIDGVDHWSALTAERGTRRSRRPPRREMLYNYEVKESGHLVAAIRVGAMKLVLDNTGADDGWVPDPAEFEEQSTNKTKNQIRTRLVSGVGAFTWSGLPVTNAPMLFNLTADPEERINLSGSKPRAVRTLMARLEKLKSGMLPANALPEDKAGNPANFGGVWQTGWCTAISGTSKNLQGIPQVVWLLGIILLAA